MSGLIWLHFDWFVRVWFCLIWFVLIWYHMIWYDIISCDILWYDLTWLDLTWLDLTWLDLTWLALPLSAFLFLLLFLLLLHCLYRLSSRWPILILHFTFFLFSPPGWPWAICRPWTDSKSPQHVIQWGTNTYGCAIQTVHILLGAVQWDGVWSFGPVPWNKGSGRSTQGLYARGWTWYVWTPPKSTHLTKMNVKK